MKDSLPQLEKQNNNKKNKKAKDDSPGKKKNNNNNNSKDSDEDEEEDNEFAGNNHFIRINSLFLMYLILTPFPFDIYRSFFKSNIQRGVCFGLL